MFAYLDRLWPLCLVIVSILLRLDLDLPGTCTCTVTDCVTFKRSRSTLPVGILVEKNVMRSVDLQVQTTVHDEAADASPGPGLIGRTSRS